MVAVYNTPESLGLYSVMWKLYESRVVKCLKSLVLFIERACALVPDNISVVCTHSTHKKYNIIFNYIYNILNGLL